MMLQQLLAKKRSKATVHQITVFVGNDSNRFAELVEAMFHGTPQATFTAAWSMSYCAEQFPELLHKHYTSLLAAVSKKDSSETLKRNIIRAFQFAEIPKRHQGKVATCCFRFLEDKKEAIAIRVFSMSVLANLAMENPGLKEELILLIEDGIPYASPAYLSRAKKVLKRLKSLRHTNKD